MDLSPNLQTETDHKASKNLKKCLQINYIIAREYFTTGSSWEIS
jgi:hypothetical protein